MTRRRREAKPKRVTYELLDRDSVRGHPIYALLDELVQAHHQELERARIALAWCTSWKPDADGITKLGQCKKASELDRQLHSYDFVILLKKGFWIDDRVTDAQRRALLDHELCHARVKYGPDGQPSEDEHGHTIYRVRKHDVEEFREIVERHGTWKADLEQFAAALRRSVPDYTPCDLCKDERPGWQITIDADGQRRVGRCQCWRRWMQTRKELAG